MQKSDDANRTRHIAETHLPRTSLSEADASPPNVIDGAAGSFLAYKVRYATSSLITAQSRTDGMRYNAGDGGLQPSVNPEITDRGRVLYDA